MHRRRASGSSDAARPRIAVLTADVGEGHVAAARALAAELRAERPDAEVVILDALAGLGAFLRYLLRDAYRWQLRRAPWVFGSLFALFSRIALLRALGRVGLAFFGGRGLLRMLSDQQPDLVVSTYPAATSVLGSLKRRGRLTMPTCATVTDLAGLEFWAHAWVDRHLVMHESSVNAVERVAGKDSVYRARPPIGSAFFEPLPRELARRRLSLPHHAPVIVVSGGGWGVGDIAGAIEACLELPDPIVVCVTGRNECLRQELSEAYRGERRVRVLGFTDQMSELLAAADALIHSTGGVTCLEAIVRGCPVIVFGAPRGHAPRAARTMADYSLAAVAATPVELASAVRQVLATPAAERPTLAPAPTCASLAFATTLRRQRKPLVKARAVRAVAVALAAVGGWTFLSDDAYPLATRVLDLEPLTRVSTDRPQVAVVVRAPATAVVDLLPLLGRSRAHVSFAFTAAPEQTVLQRLRRAGDQPLPELEPGALAHWIDTKDELESEAAHLHVDRKGFYLAPPSGFTLSQHLLGRDVGATPIAGTWHLVSSPGASTPRFRPGDIVVLSLGPNAPQARHTLVVLLASLERQGLHPVPVQALIAARANGSG